MLLTRYGDLAFVMDLPLDSGVGLINKAMEKKADDKRWQLWLALRPHMSESDFVPFDQFAVVRTVAESSAATKASAAAIMDDVENIKAMMKGGVQ